MSFSQVMDQDATLLIDTGVIVTCGLAKTRYGFRQVEDGLYEMTSCRQEKRNIRVS